MLKDCEWSKDRDYKTDSKNEPLQFYLDGLANSNEFNLLLGYFSSSAINLLSVGFATFISKGGTMKMVINHLLSSKDKEAITKIKFSILIGHSHLYLDKRIPWKWMRLVLYTLFFIRMVFFHFIMNILNFFRKIIQ